MRATTDAGRCFVVFLATARRSVITGGEGVVWMGIIVVLNIFIPETKRTELSSDKEANDERHNHYASKHLRAK